MTEPFDNTYYAYYHAQRSGGRDRQRRNLQQSRCAEALPVMHEAPVECSYEPCNCSVVGPVEGGEAYCSPFCSDASDQSLESDFCSCGHPPCDEP